MALDTDGLAPLPRGTGGDLVLLAAVAVVAYRFGKSAGAKSHTATSAAAIIASYFGLRAMDKVFGELLRDRR